MDVAVVPTQRDMTGILGSKFPRTGCVDAANSTDSGLGVEQMKADDPNENRRLPTVRQTLFLMSTIAICSALLTWRSYRRSDSLTFLDMTMCTDEGLLSLQVPLVRLATSEQPSTQWVTYRRGTNIWEAFDGEGGKSLLRNWMSMLDATGCKGGMIFGIGYWKGSWQSNSRPGPFIVMFMPIWVAIATTLTLIAVAYLLRMRFSLATMLLGTTIMGGLLWLLSLRATA
jgi:hypothetical protein